MSNRTRLLATHQLALVLPKADLVLCLKDLNSERGIRAPNSSRRDLSDAGSIAAFCHPLKLGQTLRSSGIYDNIADRSSDADFVSIIESLVLHSVPLSELPTPTRSRQGSVDSLIDMEEGQNMNENPQSSDFARSKVPLITRSISEGLPESCSCDQLNGLDKQKGLEVR